MIKINRKKEFRDKIRSYKIILDNRLLGQIKSGEMREFNIPAGKHKIYLKMDWCRSNVLNFTIYEKEILEFQCGNSMREWTIVSFLSYATFLKNRYLWINIRK